MSSFHDLHLCNVEVEQLRDEILRKQTYLRIALPVAMMIIAAVACCMGFRWAQIKRMQRQDNKMMEAVRSGKFLRVYAELEEHTTMETLTGYITFGDIGKNSRDEVKADGKEGIPTVIVPVRSTCEKG